MTDDTPLEPDATRIRSVAVHRTDVANALEATLRSDRTVVLRVTPPFSGRMRARLHSIPGDVDDRRDGEERPAIRPEGATGPIQLSPGDLVEAIPSYPEVDETAENYPDADVDTRRERHADAVVEWRETVSEAVGGCVTVPVAGGTHRIEVVGLG